MLPSAWASEIELTNLQRQQCALNSDILGAIKESHKQSYRIGVSHTYRTKKWLQPW